MQNKPSNNVPKLVANHSKTQSTSHNTTTTKYDKENDSNKLNVNTISNITNQNQKHKINKSSSKELFNSKSQILTNNSKKLVRMNTTGNIIYVVICVLATMNTKKEPVSKSTSSSKERAKFRNFTNLYKKQ